MSIDRDNHPEVEVIAKVFSKKEIYILSEMEVISEEDQILALKKKQLEDA